MSVPPLNPDLTRDVLAFLGVEAAAPSLSHVDALLQAYTQSVPWESFFRIARRDQVSNTADCPRWPEQFWRDAMERGGGGTCFESNYAFFSLLRALGYDGYLTVNNMSTTIGCHTAAILHLDDANWLVDVGLPVYAVLPVDPAEVTQRTSRFHTYMVRPNGVNQFEIERDKHPKANAFTLINLPVENGAYRQHLTSDYGENGLFLDRAIATKVMSGYVWRFDNGALPPHFEAFKDGERRDYPITDDVAAAVSQQFDMDENTVRAALGALKT